MKRLAGFISAAAIALAAAACGNTDAGITSAVKSKLAADDTVKAYQIDVDTSNHVVTLSGDVESAAAKQHAVMIARNTDGVTDVIDQLRVDATAATTGVDIDGPDIDVDVDVDERTKAAAREGASDAERGARRGANAVKDGAEKAGDAIVDGAKKAGAAAKDAARDIADDDSDNDGK